MGGGDRTRVLIVDDEKFLRDLIVRFLEREPYEVTLASSAEEALKKLISERFSLLITDIHMPGQTGLELLEQARRHDPDLAVLVVTGLDDRRTATKALLSGAFGYVIKPFDQNELLINITNALERRRLGLQSKQVKENLEEEVRRRTTEIRRNQEEILARLLSATELRDAPTGAHIRRISYSSSLLAEALGWDSTRVNDIQVAASMHDVGKIGTPDRILLKPGRLTEEEYRVMQEHTLIGARILDHPQIPLLQMAREIALTHHERWDGKGYPQGLSGEKIPESGRIVAVADVYDALVSNRVYRPAWPEEQVIEHMTSEKGGHFDPRILDAFLGILPRVREIWQTFPDR